MKFLCVTCDAQMKSSGQTDPGDGTLAITFRCPECEREVAMLANPMETQMVSSLCVQVGGRSEPERPFEMLSSRLEGGGAADRAGGATADRPGGSATEREGGAVDRQGAEGAGVPSGDGSPRWSPEAEERLERAPRFARGMIRHLYNEWARERAIAEITPAVMDRARADLDLDGV
jgi:hypothetical protein